MITKTLEFPFWRRIFSLFHNYCNGKCVIKLGCASIGCEQTHATESFGGMFFFLSSLQLFTKNALVCGVEVPLILFFAVGCSAMKFFFGLGKCCFCVREAGMRLQVILSSDQKTKAICNTCFFSKSMYGVHHGTITCISGETTFLFFLLLLFKTVFKPTVNDKYTQAHTLNIDQNTLVDD